MVNNTFTVRFRKYQNNQLLNRKQMILDVFHPESANVSKADLQAHLRGLFKASDDKCVVCFGFKTAFGGGKSTGFAFVYDSLESLFNTEPKYRLVRAGLLDAKTGARAPKRQLKNRKKKVRGTAKAKVGGGKKK